MYVAEYMCECVSLYILIMYFSPDFMIIESYFIIIVFSLSSSLITPLYITALVVFIYIPEKEKKKI